jgi:hypothetical protein
MSEIKHTKGPYERNGATVYALQHHGWRKGEEQFCNRVYASVYAGPGCPPEEAEAVARLFQAAPELLEALQWMLTLHEGIGGEPYGTPDLARAAIAKAIGGQS